MTVNIWSQTAATNANIDPTVNWRESQAPSTVNNSARAMMAAIAKWRDDLAGNLVTGGSSTAYTITTNQGLTPLVDGYSVWARMDETNGVSPTLNVDATGAKAIRVSTGTAVPTGAMPGGSVQKFTYDGGDDCWYVASFYATTSLALSGLQLHEATELTSAATDDELAIYDLSATTNKRITLTNLTTSLPASETVAGFVEMATTAEIASATTGAKAVMAEDLETASAMVALTDASTVAVNWDAGINFSLTVTASRAIGNPTNGQPGTWRTILVQADTSTDRTITFGNQYLGEVPTITDCDNDRWYLISIYCVTSSHFVASSKRAKG
jgi:hypothetical protein